MRSKIMIIFAMLLLVTCLAVPAVASEVGGLITPGMVEDAAKDANISSAQMKEIMSFWYKNEKEIVKIKADMEIKSLDLESAMQMDKPDPKVIMGLVQQFGDLRTKLDLQTTKFSLKVLEVLRPEQMKKLKEIMQKRSISSPTGPECEGVH